MNTETKSLSLEAETNTFPIEVHVFKHRDFYYAFDARNFSILKLDDNGAAVLSRMHNLPLGAITEELAPKVDSQSVRAYYLEFLKFIQDGTLSVQPVPSPERPPFNRLVLMLAGGCNMGCAYCFEKDVPIYQHPNLMTREIASKTLNWFFRHQESRRARIQLYGGEPLLNWSVLKYVVERMEMWAQENDIELTSYLITNGTLLNSKRIGWLKSHDVVVQVSVDGDPETHNRFRVFKSGRPTFDKIKPNIDELLKQGVDFNLRAVITRQNVNPKTVINGLRLLGAEKVSFEVVSTDNSDAQFSSEEWNAFNRMYFNFVNLPFKTWSYLTLEMRNTIIRICERERAFYGCGAGINEVTIGPDGSIYECERLYKAPYSIISDDRSPTELDSQFLTMVDDRPICKDCWARYLCGGGCMHQSHTAHMEQNPLPEFCQMKHILIEASVVKINEIKALNKPVNDLPISPAEATCTTEHWVTRA